MGVESKERADGVIASFRALLDGNTLDAVGEGNLHALHGMIEEAIMEQSGVILERLRQDLRQIESEMVERTPLEL